jgi:hypothetical protein
MGMLEKSTSPAWYCTYHSTQCFADVQARQAKAEITVPRDLNILVCAGRRDTGTVQYF